MGDHDNRLIELAIKLLEHFQDNSGVLGVQIAGRLVGEDDRRSIYNRPRKCNTLLLAAGQLQGFMMQLVLESEQRQNLATRFGVLRAPAISMNVFCKTQIPLGCKGWKEIESLKNKADFPASDISTLRIAHSCQVLSIYDDASRGGLEQTAQDMQQA